MFFIITGIHLTDNSDSMQLMRLVIGISFLLLISCFLSYMSIRSTKRSEHYEHIADTCFLIAIALLFLTMGMLAFDFGIVW